MAINYTPTNWDTTTPLNPTNFNHFEQGIKSACDEVDALEPSTETVSGTLFLDSNFTIQKFGKLRILHFANRIKAGTYPNTTNLITLPVAPISTQHAVLWGESAARLITTYGRQVRFNTQMTFSTDAYLIGQLVYIVA